MRLADYDKAGFAASEQRALGVFDFGDTKAVAAFLTFLPAFDDDFAIDGDGLFVLNVEISCNGTLVVELGKFAHGFIEDHGDDSAVRKTTAAGIVGAKSEATASAASIEIEFERKPHASRISGAATEAMVGGLRIEFANVGHWTVLAALDESHVGAFGAPCAALAFANFDAKNFGENGNGTDDLFFVEAGKTQTQGVGQRGADVEVAARREENTALAGMNHQF